MTPRFLGDPLAGNWSVRLQPRPPGLWVGVWWCRPVKWELDIRICLIPGLPLKIEWLGPPASLIARCRPWREAP
jgi:hypothetical protein